MVTLIAQDGLRFIDCDKLKSIKGIIQPKEDGSYEHQVGLAVKEEFKDDPTDHSWLIFGAYSSDDKLHQVLWDINQLTIADGKKTITSLFKKKKNTSFKLPKDDEVIIEEKAPGEWNASDYD